MSRGAAGSAPLIVLAAVVLLPALALFGLWRLADGQTTTGTVESLPPTTVAAADGATPSVLGTPLLSFRRVPGLLARDLNDDAFAAAVSSFAGTLDATSCLVVQLDGVEVGSHNPDLAVIPASNQKLLVAAAALEVLGPDHVFTTEVRAGPVSGGVVAGDVYLVGGGDPLLTSDDYPAATINGFPVLNATSLDALADSVVAAGISRIDGNVVGDGSRYDDEFFHPTWPIEIYLEEAGPLDALVVNDARVLADDWQVADDPNIGAAAELGRLLEERGVTIAGERVSGTAPEGATTIASIQSQPLPAVIAEMQATSDNNTAEMLVKELGAATGAGGTWTAGAAAVITALAATGVDPAGIVVDDGSGLSNENRVTCRALATVLERYEPGDDFAQGLPVAAESGTLEDTFVDSSVAGRLVAKTGTLSNPPYNADPPAVKALSGYLPVDGGGTIEFALVLNSTGTLADQSVYRPIWDDFADVLAAYPAGPSAMELGPG